MVQGTQKRWLLKAGDPLIEVTTWAGLTVFTVKNTITKCFVKLLAD